MLSSNQGTQGNSYKALLLLLAALLACGGGAIQASGELVPTGAYRHPVFDYGIEPSQSKLMADTWRLENFYTDKRGKLVRKSDKVEIGFDFEGDDRPDEFKRFEVNDLVFEHQQTAGYISIVAYPESGTDRNKRLEVLMARLLRAYASLGAWRVLMTGNRQAVAAAKENVTASIKQQGPATLAKREAYVATFDRVNVDQAKVGADGRLETVQLVMVRTGIDYEIKTEERQQKKKSSAGAAASSVVEHVHKFPVMLLAMYSNQPNLFEENLPDFRDLLNRVRIGTESGFSDQSAAPGNPAPVPVSQPGTFDPEYGAPVGPAPSAPAPQETAVPGASEAGSAAGVASDPKGSSTTPASDAPVPPATK